MFILQTSLIHITERKVIAQIVKFGAGITLLTFLLVALTPVGFPYSSLPGRIAPKRLALQHFHREEYGLSGEMTTQDNGVWVVPLDYLGMKPLSNVFNLSTTIQSDCDGKLYCGLPFIYPIMKLFKY